MNIIRTTASLPNAKAIADKYENLVIISKDQFRDYYGTVFADRAWFAAGMPTFSKPQQNETNCLAQNLIRINECTKEELQSNSKIGNDMASQIIKQRNQHRFFRDWESLKAAVPQFPDSHKQFVLF